MRAERSRRSPFSREASPEKEAHPFSASCASAAGVNPKRSGWFGLNASLLLPKILRTNASTFCCNKRFSFSSAAIRSSRREIVSLRSASFARSSFMVGSAICY